MSDQTTTITASDVIRRVRELAAERPDFIYPQQPIWGCSNIPRDGRETGCIVGQALLDLGITVQQFVGLKIAQAGALFTLRTLEITYTIHEIRWLQAAQSQQDQGRTWSTAVGYADEFAALP